MFGSFVYSWQVKMDRLIHRRFEEEFEIGTEISNVDLIHNDQCSMIALIA